MITITITEADITNDGIRLMIRAVHSASQKTIQFQRTFAITMSAAEIKADIDNVVILLFQAFTNGEWTIEM